MQSIGNPQARLASQQQICSLPTLQQPSLLPFVFGTIMLCAAGASHALPITTDVNKETVWFPRAWDDRISGSPAGGHAVPVMV